MTTKLAQLGQAASRLRETCARAALAPFVMLACSPAMAALPTMPAPGDAIGGGTVAQGDWLGTMGAWIKAGLTILVLVLAALGFVYVLMGALGKWRAYSMGRAEIGDLKEYFVMGAVLAVFLVVMGTYAFETLA